MFLDAMRIAEKLQQSFFCGEVVAEYRAGIIGNRHEVMQYLIELVEANDALTTTATYKWNQRNG